MAWPFGVGHRGNRKQARQVSAPAESTGIQKNKWWRRGRVELPVQKRVARIYYRLSRPPFVSPDHRPPTESGQASQLIFPGVRRQLPRGTPAFRRSLSTHRGEIEVNAQPI